MLQTPQSCLAPAAATAEVRADNDRRAWERVRARLRAEIGEEAFSSWFGLVKFEGVIGETVRLSVPTRFLKSWIASHYSDRVLACWKDEEPAVRRVDLTVRSGLLRSAPAAPKNSQTIGTEEKSLGVPRPLTAPEQFGGSPLDPKLTFDTFVVGQSNSFAHAMAKEVTAAPRDEQNFFNPLYVHAQVGLGKTHILQAMAWAGINGMRHFAYLTAEKFTFSVRNHTSPDFRNLLRSHTLLADDLQFLQGREATRAFSYILNSMIDAGRLVVVAADRPPLDLENLDERVRSRLAGGLVVEMGPLGEELRLEILKCRVAAARQHNPDFDVPPDVLAFIARSVTHNGRDLEGALNRLIACSRIAAQPITLDVAEREIRDLVRPAEPRRIKIEEIIHVVARHYGVSRSDIVSARRTANVVRPRQVGYWLAKHMTLKSLPEIGRRFGGRDHTTALSGIRRIDGLIQSTPALAEEIKRLQTEILELA